jgi:hypothetical protein
MDHVKLLDDFDELMPSIYVKDDVPFLRHPDLTLSNIFIDPEDLTITGILDWQGARVVPATVQAGYPSFSSNNGQGVSRLGEVPEKPKNLESLDPAERENAMAAWILQLSCQLYVLETRKRNRAHFDILQRKKNSIRAELVTRAGLLWNGDLVAFRNAILDVLKSWELFSIDSNCPLQYSAAEIKQWEEEYKEWSEASDSLEAFRMDLGINEEGWVESHSYETTAERNWFLRRELTINASLKHQKEICSMWPFKDSGDLSEWDVN